MKPTTSLALVVSAFAVTSVTGSSLLRPRGFEELWGGTNITAAALEIRDAISTSCAPTGNCTSFVNDVIPRCLKLQGTAGCWCSLHDPLHYCAICMSSPQDAGTTADQTQAAAEGHKHYHEGCAAFQASLTASSSAPAATGTSGAQTDDGDDHDHSGMATGTIVGIAVGGVAFLAIVIAATFLTWKCLKNQADRDTRGGAGAANEKRQDSMPLGDPVRITSYFGGTDMAGHPQPLHTPPYQTPNPYPAQPYSPPINSAVPLLESMAARPDSMYTTAQSQQGSYNPAMRATSEFGGSSQGGSQQQQPQMYQPNQYHVQNDRDAPPPFSPHPQGYDTSILGGAPSSSNEKARYQGSPQP